MAEWSTEFSHGGYCRLVDTSQLADWLTVVASGTANTKGSWTEATSSLYESSTGGLLVSFAGVTANADFLLDIGVGGAGSEVIIAENLSWDAQNRVTSWMHLPLCVPSGSRVAARVQSSTASHSTRIAIHGITRGPWARPMVGSQIVALGAATGDSGGTAVDAGATANAFGAWVQLSASTSVDICALRIHTGQGTNTAPTSTGFGVQIGLGAAASEVVLLGPVKFPCAGTGDYAGPVAPFWYPCQIPAGSRVAARLMSNTADATDRILDVTAYGLVA